ncbi:MAG: hypothetical protein Unbinned6437contig1000_27 [Prokaryotic dsDNA virus sp.]|nr:MAG: hypothetical protein Unbinned6437contig1000_27 [Prokaryotic dsDNA virus sp.]|tara:strand:- start:26145 stop:26387 length:243 start_codon:yes stop_codon:yes gene_type:complete
MKADYIQRTEEGSITHKDCEYIVYDIKDLGNGEVLAKCKVKNLVGEFVGLIPFHFNKSGNDIIEDQANIELENIVEALIA